MIDFGPDFQLQTLQSRFPNLTMSLLDPPHIEIEKYTFGQMQQLFSAACSIALVVILETLISARIAGMCVCVCMCMYVYVSCAMRISICILLLCVYTQQLF